MKKMINVMERTAVVTNKVMTATIKAAKRIDNPNPLSWRYNGMKYEVIPGRDSADVIISGKNLRMVLTFSEREYKEIGDTIFTLQRGGDSSRTFIVDGIYEDIHIEVLKDGSTKKRRFFSKGPATIDVFFGLHRNSVNVKVSDFDNTGCWTEIYDPFNKRGKALIDMFRRGYEGIEKTGHSFEDEVKETIRKMGEVVDDKIRAMEAAENLEREDILAMEIREAADERIRAMEAAENLERDA